MRKKPKKLINIIKVQYHYSDIMDFKTKNRIQTGLVVTAIVGLSIGIGNGIRLDMHDKEISKNNLNNNQRIVELRKEGYTLSHLNLSSQDNFPILNNKLLIGCEEQGKATKIERVPIFVTPTWSNIALMTKCVPSDVTSLSRK
jgi:hypothetical protein